MKNGWSRNAISGEKWVVSSCAFSILSSAPSPPRVACRQAIARGAKNCQTLRSRTSNIRMMADGLLFDWCALHWFVCECLTC